MSMKNTLPENSAAPSKAVITAIKKLLRPLVRLLMSFQITLPFLVDLLKEVYVDVAEKDFTLDNKKQTDTRISMLTGVHRKDTKRLRNKEKESELSPESVSIGVQLVTKWISDPLYLDKQGKPRLLALKASGNESTPEFEDLVQSVCKQDMRARVILDEWLRLGIASLIEDKWVQLESQGFIPSKGLDEKAFYLGMNLSDHIEASAQNLLSEQPPFLERCVYYHGLSESSIQRLEESAREKGMALLQELNRQAIQLKEQDQEQTRDEANEKYAPHRMNFGLYFFTQAEEKDDEQV
jgi:hypothetical protein